jgi:hypothetical protein
MVVCLAVITFWYLKNKNRRFRPRPGEVLLALLVGTALSAAVSYSLVPLFNLDGIKDTPNDRRPAPPRNSEDDIP